jgi:protein transport protein SEC24
VDNGRILVMWLGQACPPSFYSQAFGVQSLPPDASGLNPEPVRPGSELSARINGVLRQLRARRELWQECWVLRQGTPMEAHLMPLLVEDRQAAAGSQGYLDFMLTLQKMLMAK